MTCLRIIVALAIGTVATACSTDEMTTRNLFIEDFPAERSAAPLPELDVDAILSSSTPLVATGDMVTSAFGVIITETPAETVKDQKVKQ